jgi:hypothetical protein
MRLLQLAATTSQKGDTSHRNDPDVHVYLQWIKQHEILKWRKFSGWSRVTAEVANHCWPCSGPRGHGGSTSSVRTAQIRLMCAPPPPHGRITQPPQEQRESPWLFACRCAISSSSSMRHRGRHRQSGGCVLSYDSKTNMYINTTKLLKGEPLYFRE